MEKDYPAYFDDLRVAMRELRKALPGPMAGFNELHRQAISEPSALETKSKELIALAIGIATHCEGCITLHTRAALRAGASPEEVLDTIGVAILMGGGPAMVYGLSALRALDQFSERKPD